PNVAASAYWLVREEAARALEEMFAAADNDGVHLVLGSGFDPRDLVVYVCAVAVAAALDAGVRSRWTARPEKAEGALPEESAF
ncbi:MAG: hypothetical protein IJG47_01585, partial [Microbacterium sp.]|nr:hypothetical protein [Microbacterium sp.]